VACNTASGASLNYLRQKFPEVIFVGMEPAIKPAKENTKTNKIGVLATATTFQGELYNSLKEKFGKEVEIFENPCLGLVNQIEKNELTSPETENILKEVLSPMLEQGVDTIVLGCTHYPFVIPLIKKIVGEEVKIIDPTGAIVRRVGELINDRTGNGQVKIFTTGDFSRMELLVYKLFKESIQISQITWNGDLVLGMIK
jgi:glutamate racemase